MLCNPDVSNQRQAKSDCLSIPPSALTEECTVANQFSILNQVFVLCISTIRYEDHDTALISSSAMQRGDGYAVKGSWVAFHLTEGAATEGLLCRHHDKINLVL